MKSFNVYETIGVVAPGVVFLLCIKWVLPDFPLDLSALDMSIGGFGVTAIVAFVVGHLLQSLGNQFEKVWWKIRGGWPSDWPRLSKNNLLSEHQIRSLSARLETHLGLDATSVDQNTSAESWHSIFRQIYAYVASAGKDSRAVSFNANYGLFRGIVSCMIILITIGLFNWGESSGKALLGFVIISIIATIRMDRFAIHYAREAYVQFLNMPTKNEGENE